MPASRGGKVKTALQAVAILLYVLPLHAFPLSGFWQAVAVVVMALAVIVTVATGVDYVLRAHKLRRTSPRADAKRKRRASAVLEVAALEAAAPEVAVSEVAVSEVAAPEVAAPEVAAPEVLAPEVAAREVAAREVAAREVAARHTAGPEV